MGEEKQSGATDERLPWRRVILQLVVLAALVLIALIGFVVPSCIVKTKTPPLSAPFPTPTELRYEPPAQIPVEENGYEVLRKAIALVPEKPQTTSFEMGWRAAVERDWISQFEVDQFLELLKPAWDLMDRALAMPRWQCPIPDGTTAGGAEAARSAPLPSQALVLLTQGRTIQAKRLVAEGREDEALSVALSVIELGRRVSNSGGSLIEFVNGVVAEGLGWGVVSQLRDTPNVSTQRLKQIASLIPDPDETNESLRLALRVGFYLVCRNELETPPARSTWLFDPNETKRRIAEDFLVEMKNVNTAFLERDRSVSKKLLEMHRAVRELKADLDKFEQTGWLATWRLARTPNAYGKWLEYIAAPVLSDRGEIMRRFHQFWANAAPTMAAMILYRREHGTLPESLQTLVDAQLLPRMPLDPFDLKPLRYSREKKRVWSVGVDGVDNGGEAVAEGASDEFAGDIVALIPEAPKKAEPKSEPPK
jgi:hypothetical protein